MSSQHQKYSSQSFGISLVQGSGSGSAAIVGTLQLVGKSLSYICNCMSYKQNDLEQFPSIQKYISMNILIKQTGINISNRI
jgi:hypothetical protein